MADTDRTQQLATAARKDFAAAITAGRAPFDAAAAVCHGWNTRAIDMGWSLDTRTKMIGWLMDLLADDLASAAQHVLALQAS